jgi:hypothetical protein
VEETTVLASPISCGQFLDPNSASAGFLNLRDTMSAIRSPKHSLLILGEQMSVEHPLLAFTLAAGLLTIKTEDRSRNGSQ